MMELPKGAKITHAGLMQHNADGTTDIQKITQAGLVARSPEGTAAKGMNIRGNEDLWVEIQANTFRNWVNEPLRDVGMQVSITVDDDDDDDDERQTSEVHCSLS
jgi:filamin